MFGETIFLGNDFMSLLNPPQAADFFLKKSKLARIKIKNRKKRKKKLVTCKVC